MASNNATCSKVVECSVGGMDRGRWDRDGGAFLSGAVLVFRGTNAAWQAGCRVWLLVGLSSPEP